MGQQAFVSMKLFRTMRTEIPEAQFPLRPWVSCLTLRGTALALLKSFSVF